MRKIILVLILASYTLVPSLSGATTDPFAKGQEHYLAGRYEIALVTLLDAVKVQPENSDCYLYIGNIYTHKRDFDKAVAYYRIGLDLASKPGIFHFNLGQAFYHGGKYRDSLDSLRRALASDGRLVDSWLEIGRAWYQMSDKTNTIAAWQRYLTEAPANPQAETIRQAIALLSQTNFLFPSQKKALADKKQAQEEARRQALRERLANLLANAGNTTSSTNGSKAGSTNSQAPVLDGRDVTTKVKDVTTKSKDKADYNKGEDIEK